MKKTIKILAFIVLSNILSFQLYAQHCQIDTHPIYKDRINLKVFTEQGDEIVFDFSAIDPSRYKYYNDSTQIIDFYINNNYCLILMKNHGAVILSAAYKSNEEWILDFKSCFVSKKTDDRRKSWAHSRGDVRKSFHEEIENVEFFDENNFRIKIIHTISTTTEVWGEYGQKNSGLTYKTTSEQKTVNRDFILTQKGVYDKNRKMLTAHIPTLLRDDSPRITNKELFDKQ